VIGTPTGPAPVTEDVFSYRFSVAARAGYSDLGASLVAESPQISVYLCCKSLEVSRKRYPGDALQAEQAALYLAGVTDDYTGRE
jgi:hypothetical protein